MKRSIKHISLLLLLAITFASCNNGESLQTYFVDNQETTNFTSLDIPTTIVEFDEANFTEDQKEAYNSVKRLNFLGYKVDGTDSETYKTELSKVQTILKNDKYNELIVFNDRKGKVVVKYIGDDDQADEFIVFGSSDEVGFGIIRILGDDMKPEKMVTLVDAMQNANVDDSQLNGIMDFFK